MFMTELVQIWAAVGSIDEARRISRYLVEERFVASAEIVPWVESVSMLNNQLDTEQVSKITLIARKEKLAEIISIIQKNSKFEIPEVLWFPIAGGSTDYLKWLEESTPLSFKS